MLEFGGCVMVSNLLVAAVAFLHLYFLVLEMFFWTRPRGLRIFGQSLEKAQASAKLAANQGLYNGFLSAGLVWGLLEPVPEQAKQIKIFFLVCVMVAGVFGALTVNRRIFFVQTLPALIAWLFVCFAAGASPIVQ
jgi:putative membrane protein